VLTIGACFDISNWESENDWYMDKSRNPFASDTAYRRYIVDCITLFKSPGKISSVEMRIIFFDKFFGAFC
jgi:hypothetical protein